MAKPSGTSKASKAVDPSWSVTLVGVLVLVAVGFFVGLIAGVVSEEPELVAGHLAGRSDNIDWTVPETTAESGYEIDVAHEAEERLPDVAAAPAVLGGPRSVQQLSHPPARVASERTIEEIPERADASVAVEPAVAPSRPVDLKSEPSFAVQVGAFAKSASAEQMADQLRARGYPTLVVPTAEARDQRWRVRVGPLSSRNEANQMARRLQTQEQLPTWVLNEGGG